MSDDRWLTVDQVAERLQLSKWTIREWLRLGKLKGSQIGGRKAGWRVPESELARVLQEGRPSPELAQSANKETAS